MTKTDLAKDCIGYVPISQFDESEATSAEKRDDGPQSEKKKGNGVFELISNFPGQLHEPLLAADNLKSSVGKIRLVATSISLDSEGDGKRLISICRQGGSTILRKKGFIAVMNTDGSLEEADDIFETRDQTDFFIWDDIIWVLNDRSFEVTFGFTELIDERAKAVVDQIIEKLDIANAEEFKKATLAGKRASRLASQLDGEAYLANLKSDAFMAYCENLKITGWGLDEDNRIELENLDSTTMTKFLDAVAENYFAGPLSNKHYKATGKVKR